MITVLSRGWWSIVLAVTAAATMLALQDPARAAGAPAYSPVNRPGPALSVAKAALARSLTCSPNLRTSGRKAVLLVPGTMLDPQVDFSWNYERAFTAQGRPWCTVTLPESGMADIQVAGEYVVNAIRTMFHRTGRKVQIVGHSQGGMVPRWALRFWPDTRHMVDDVIGLAPSNHGTVDAQAICLPAVGCAPAIWQQRLGSAFDGALNSRAETFAGISYTDVYTQLDEVVVPNFDETGSSSLHTGAGAISNIAVQSICPAHVADHLTLGTSDPVGYALVMDALRHRGPARASRISSGVCTQVFQPGVDPATFVTDFATMTAYVAQALVTAGHVSSEPKLAPYVFR